VQEAVGRLSEIVGVRADGSGGGNVRFHPEDQCRIIDGVTIVGVVR
jgi:hypothetical protein